MRLDPLNLVLTKDYKVEKRFYFISGNEKTFIDRIKAIIIENYQKKERVTLSNIASINDYVDTGLLFEEKKIILINDSKEINEGVLDSLRDTNNVYIFSQENSQKIKKIKNIFLKDRDSFLIDCYELNRVSKIKILNEFIKLSKLKINEDIYWFLVEKLDNKYAFLESSLNKILSLDEENITLFNLKRLLTIDSSGKEKVFFGLNKTNREIVEIYRNKIVTTSDVNEFYFYCKSFCQLVIDSKNKEDYYKKIPVYLFKEKNFLIDFYAKYNSEKKKMLLRLLSSTEKVLRKESGLSLVSGLRFLLTLKKITTS